MWGRNDPVDFPNPDYLRFRAVLGWKFGGCQEIAKRPVYYEPRAPETGDERAGIAGGWMRVCAKHREPATETLKSYKTGTEYDLCPVCEAELDGILNGQLIVIPKVQKEVKRGRKRITWGTKSPQKEMARCLPAYHRHGQGYTCALGDIMKLCVDCKHHIEKKETFWGPGFPHYCQYPGPVINPVHGMDWRHKNPNYLCLEFRCFDRFCGFDARWFEPK